MKKHFYSMLSFIQLFATQVTTMNSTGNDLSPEMKTYYDRRLLDYAYGQQLRDIAPALLLSLMMAAFVYPVTKLGLGDLVTLLIQVPLGVAIYAGAAWALKLESFQYVLGIAQKFVRKES